MMATLTNSPASTTTIPLGTALLDRIGNTPLVRLERLTVNLPGIQILGKAEWANPGGSVKDRAASAIVADAQQRGLLTPRKRLLPAYGANVVWTDPADGSDGAIRKARELAANQPEKFFYADQYGNNAN